MKLGFVMVVLPFDIQGCTKGSPASLDLFGKWELRRTNGGLSYRDISFQTGNGTAYQF